MSDQKAELLKQLLIIEEEHRDLDILIDRLNDQHTIDLFQMKRLKKRKLQLKDKIANLKDKIEPDIIA